MNASPVWTRTGAHLRLRGARHRSARRPARAALAIAAFGLLVVAACSGGDNGGKPAAQKPASTTTTTAKCASPVDDTAAPFVIGVVDTNTGTDVYAGPGHGAAAAAAYANCALGGVGGHPVKIVECSVGKDAPSQDACGADLAGNPQVRMVITGYVFAPDGMYASLAYVDKPVLGGIALTPIDFLSPAIRFYSAGAPGVAGGLVAYALGNLGLSVHHALIVASDPSVVPSIQPLLESAGITVSVDDPTTLGLRTMMAGADVVFGLVDQTGCIAMATAAAAIASPPPILATSLCIDAAVMASVGVKDLNGWYIGSERPMPQLVPGADPRVDTYRTEYPRYSKTDPNEAGASTGWADVLAALTALKPLGFDASTGAALRSALDGFHGPQPLGPPNLSCPGTTYPTMCTTESYVAHVAGTKLEPVTQGDAPVDVASFDPASYKASHS